MAESTSNETYYPGVFVARFVNAVVGIIELALALRVLLELLGGNTSSQFVAWVYGITNPLASPFAGAFPSIYLSNVSAIDAVAILAMVVYAIIGWLVIELLSFIFISK